MNPGYSSAHHNSLLLRFLVVATLIFVVTAGLLYLKQSGEEDYVPTEEVQKELRFSAMAGLQETIEGYRAGAQVLFDIESFPEIQTLFFRDQFDFSKDTILRRLQEVNSQPQKSDDFAKSHVYHTSYYVGNLLVRGDETLDGLLQSEARPQTTLLLETFLADVRAGTLALQMYFDQATPAQHDPTLGGALYFTHPTFPSLTAAEAAAVLFTLANLDPKNAALYEYSLHQYLNQTFATRAHFRIDIEYALRLVTIYFNRIQKEPTYLALKEMATREWLGSEKVETVLLPLTPEFAVEGFPETTTPETTVYNSVYIPLAPEEALEGQLRLSLIDLRLPNPVSTLYEYQFGSEQILPITSQFVPRKYPNLEPAAYAATYESPINYLFLTGSQPKINGISPLPLSPARIVSRNQNTIDLLVGDSTDGIIRIHPQRSIDKNLLLFTEADAQSAILDMSATGTVKIFTTENILVRKISDTRGATFIASDTKVAFLRGESIFVNTINGTEEEVLVATVKVPVQAFGIKKGLEYFPDGNILLYFMSYTDASSAQTRSEIILYFIDDTSGKLELQEASRFSLVDAAVASAALSPGGRYLAVTQTSDLSQSKRGVLIFDTISGIIVKDIPLTPFAAQLLHLDAWTLF